MCTGYAALYSSDDGSRLYAGYAVLFTLCSRLSPLRPSRGGWPIAFSCAAQCRSLGVIWVPGVFSLQADVGVPPAVVVPFELMPAVAREVPQAW